MMEWLITLVLLILQTIQTPVIAQTNTGDVVVSHVPNGIAGYVIDVDPGVIVRDIRFVFPSYHQGRVAAVDMAQEVNGPASMIRLFTANPTSITVKRFEDDEGNPQAIQVGRYIGRKD